MNNLKKILSPYFQLTKPRIGLLVIITAYLGYYLGLRSLDSHMLQVNEWMVLIHLMIGMFMSCSGACAFNQIFEASIDAKMDRTKNRPLPLKKISSFSAYIFAISLFLISSAYLYLFVNSTVAILSCITYITYLFIYTPLKRKTTLNTLVGAIPGALPPIGGWAAATDEINSLEPLTLFLILFCWQIPHFLSLAIIYKDDYAKAGYKMLPSISDNLDSTMFQIVFFTVALIVSSICIYLLKLTSIVYVIGAIILGMVFLFYSSSILFEESNKKIRRLFLFSIIYFPLLLLLIFLDTIFL